MQYMTEQAAGQMSLLWNAKNNEEILKDKNLDSQSKEKIKRIQHLKDYFYSYFNKKRTAIYDKTVLLGRDAVTYLVIVSPKDIIKAKQECFPFVGCFPYLGFFSLESAKNYAKHMIDEGNSIWIRPVTAYSTLGNFSDPILSTFFQYSDNYLVEVIFHELFHTIYFPKNEVDLNENMASYFARKMSYEYLKLSNQDIEEEKNREEKSRKLRRKIVDLTQSLNELYQKKEKKPSETLETFLKKTFIPEIEKECKDIELDECSPLKYEWNNARFAAFLTYEKSEKRISQLHQKKGGDLKDFYKFLVMQYDKYKDLNKNESFSEFLFSEVDK